MRLVLAVLLSGCAAETALTRDTFRVDPELQPGCIALSTTRLDFQTPVDEPEERAVRIDSVCEGVLELYAFSLDDGQTPFEVDAPSDRTLELNVQVEVVVRFVPRVPGPSTDRLFITSNDQDLPQAEVVLSGDTTE